MLSILSRVVVVAIMFANIPQAKAQFVDEGFGNPANVILVDSFPLAVSCDTDSNCEQKYRNAISEYGCVEWRNLIWCDGPTYRLQLLRHKA